MPNHIHTQNVSSGIFRRTDRRAETIVKAGKAKNLRDKGGLDHGVAQQHYVRVPADLDANKVYRVGLWFGDVNSNPVTPQSQNHEAVVVTSGGTEVVFFEPDFGFYRTDLGTTRKAALGHREFGGHGGQGSHGASGRGVWNGRAAKHSTVLDVSIAVEGASPKAHVCGRGRSWTSRPASHRPGPCGPSQQHGRPSGRQGVDADHLELRLLEYLRTHLGDHSLTAAGSVWATGCAPSAWKPADECTHMPNAVPRPPRGTGRVLHGGDSFVAQQHDLVVEDAGFDESQGGAVFHVGEDGFPAAEEHRVYEDPVLVDQARAGQ